MSRVLEYAARDKVITKALGFLTLGAAAFSVLMVLRGNSN